MSREHRVKKLEQKFGAGFRVAYPHQLDSLGNGFERAPRNEQVAALRYRCEGKSHVISKQRGETPRDFFSRAEEEAREHFQAKAILPAGAKWV